MTTDQGSILDDLDADDDQGADSGPASAGRGGETSTIKEMRRALTRAEKERKQFETELAELREYRDTRVKEEKQKQVSSVFTELQLNERQVPLFEATFGDGEVSKEAVAKWASQYGLLSEDNVDAAAAAAVQEPEKFTPIAGQTPDVGRLPLKKLNREEWLTLAKSSDPAERQKAQQMYAQGRVDLTDIGPVAYQSYGRE